MVAFKDDVVTLRGRTDVSHIPRQPFWLLIVRGVQVLLSIIILGLSAYAGSGYYFYAGFGIGIFSFIWTILFIAYIEISTFWFPVAYNKYAQLVLECLSVIFWLSTFAALAVVAAAWGIADDITTCSVYDTYCYKFRARNIVANYGSLGGATKGAAALGAIEWALFIGTLISFGIYLHRHRREQHAASGFQGAATTNVEEHKMGPVVNQQQVPYEQVPAQQQPANYQYQHGGEMA